MINKPSRAKTAPSPLPNGLVEELSRLDEALGHAQQGPGLMVVRFFDRVSFDQWEKLPLTVDQAQWQAIELEAEPYPKLRELMARLVDHREGEYGRLLTWQGLKRSLCAELERARQENTPLSLAIVEIHGRGKGTKTVEPCLMQALTHLFLSRQRAFDRLSVGAGNRFAMLWPGLGPLRSQAYLAQFFAEATTLLASHAEAQGLVVSAGSVATRGSNTLDADDFSELAKNALGRAKKRGGGRVEHAASPDAPVHSSRTLVGGDEKRFLFGR